MLQGQFTLLNSEGLHARPAGIIVKTSNEFQSKIEIVVDGNRVNGKSMMSLLGLGLEGGAQFELCVHGADEAQAFAKMQDLIQNKFYVS